MNYSGVKEKKNLNTLDIIFRIIFILFTWMIIAILVSGSVNAINTGLNALWKFRIEGNLISSPSLENGVVYISSDDNYVYALDAITGDFKWKYKAENKIIDSPSLENGVVYISSDDNYVYALDAITGDFKWKYKVENRIIDSPSLENGVVYISSDDNYVYALDATTGEFKWKHKVKNKIIDSPSVENNIVYVSSDDHYVYAYKLEINSALQAEQKISNAQDAINDADSIGADTTQSQILLQKAQKAYIIGQYENASTYATISQESAQKAKEEKQTKQSMAEQHKEWMYSASIYAIAIFLLIFVVMSYFKIKKYIQKKKLIKKEMEKKELEKEEKIKKQKSILVQHFNQSLKMDIELKKNSIELGELLEGTVSINCAEYIADSTIKIIIAQNNDESETIEIQNLTPYSLKHTPNIKGTYEVKPNKIGDYHILARGVFSDQFGNRYTREITSSYEVTPPKPNLSISAKDLNPLKALESSKLLVTIENKGYADAKNIILDVKGSEGIKILDIPTIYNIPRKSNQTSGEKTKQKKGLLSTVEIPFKALKDGKQKIFMDLMYSGRGQTYKKSVAYEIDVIPLNPSATIILDVPPDVKVNQTLKGSVSVKNTGIDKMTNIKLQVLDEHFVQNVINPDELKTFDFEVPSYGVGCMNINANLEYTDESGKKYTKSVSKLVTVKSLNPEANIKIKLVHNPIMGPKIRLDIVLKNIGTDPLLNPDITLVGDDFEIVNRRHPETENRDQILIQPNQEKTFQLTGIFSGFGEKKLNAYVEYQDELGKKHLKEQSIKLIVNIPDPEIESIVDMDKVMQVGKDHQLSIKLQNNGIVKIKNIIVVALFSNKIKFNSNEFKIDEIRSKEAKTALFKVRPIITGKINLGNFELIFEDIAGQKHKTIFPIGSVKVSKEVTEDSNKEDIKVLRKVEKMRNYIDLAVELSNPYDYDIQEVVVKLNPQPNIEVVAHKNKIEIIKAKSLETIVFTLKNVEDYVYVVKELINATYEYYDPIKKNVVNRTLKPNKIMSVWSNCPVKLHLTQTL